MHGWKGKILLIHLDTQKWEALTPSIELYKKWIGGRGLAGHFMYNYIRKDWNSPEMPLIFMTGPLVGTSSPTSGRTAVMSKSPLTGTIGDASVGGRFGTMLKRAGWDGIILTGKSPALCGIEMLEHDVQFADASRFAGSDVPNVLKQLPKNVSTAIIGPAAENGVLFASIVIDGHFFAGRAGLGLIMADKKVKYITASGTERIAIHNSAELGRAREEIYRLVSASPILKGELGISEFGTGAIYDLISSRRMMPTENFRKTFFESASSMNAWSYRRRYGMKKAGCSGCHILCKKRDREGMPIPEFETMSHFSALLSNSDIGASMDANRICNAAGMDTISAAATLACYAEIRGKDLAPLEITSLLNDIAYSRGEGEMLKHGSRRYAIEHGRPDASISVKGLELPAYDPRGACGMALAYATSTRGGCHLRAYPIAHEILRKPVATDRFTFSGKARIIKLSEDINAAVDSLTACRFIFFAATLEEYARALYGATGVQTDAQGLLSLGERICYAERIMNAANGFDSGDDDLPARFFSEPGSSGNGIIVKPLDREEFLKSRSNYYAIRGLDGNGIPTKEKCGELGLEWNPL